jgi:hypothetical protein
MKNATILYSPSIFENDFLDSTEKLIYLMICNFCYEQKFFSNKDISEKIKIKSIAKISRTIKKLSNLGYIKIKLEQNYKRTITLNLDLSAQYDAAPSSTPKKHLDFRDTKRKICDFVLKNKTEINFKNTILKVDNYSNDIIFSVAIDKNRNARIFNNYSQKFLTANDANDVWRAIVRYVETQKDFFERLNHEQS